MPMQSHSFPLEMLLIFKKLFQEFFSTQNINSENIKTTSQAAMGDLWSILDVNGDGVLDMEEFLEGMRQMEGPAKSYDLIKMNVKCSGLQKRIHKLGHWFMATIPEAKRLAMLVDNTHGNMMSLFGLLRPLERDVLRIVRHMAEENELKTDEFGMPTIDIKCKYVWVWKKSRLVMQLFHDP